MERTVGGRPDRLGRPGARDADPSGRGASAGRCPVAPAAAVGAAPDGQGREKGGDEGPVLRPELHPVSAELPLQDGDLMPQSQNLKAEADALQWQRDVLFRSGHQRYESHRDS
jgi:hypothetical protein